MSIDRELLELAAKAAGITYTVRPDVSMEGGPDWLAIANGNGFEEWNPLTDDGDALRLAVKLDMSVDVDEGETSTYAYAGQPPRKYAWELWGNDKDAATRRAIVRAAAEIGRSMP